MTAPFEVSCHQHTKALTCYNILRFNGSNTKALIKATYDAVMTAHNPEFPGISDAFIQSGIDLLSGSFCTFDGTTIVPMQTVIGPAGTAVARPLRRGADGESLEYVP